MIVAPNSPIPRAKRQRRPGAEPAGGERERDAQNARAGPGAERAGGEDQVVVEVSNAAIAWRR